jgi:hypothetical protein
LLGQIRILFADDRSSGSSIDSLETIVIEADKLETETKNSTVQVKAGVGAKALDPLLNEIGIEQRNMENQADISLNRRSEGWWLNVPASPLVWKNQARLDASRDQRIKLRSFGELSDYRIELEGGAFRDHRPIMYVANTANPYDNSQNRLSQYSNRRDGAYFRLSTDGLIYNTYWKGLSDLDNRFEDVYAGTNLIGDKTQTQASLNLKLHFQKLTLSPFFQYRKNQFNSKISPYLTNETQGLRVGMQNEWVIHTYLSSFASVSKESFERIRIDQSTSRFSRYHGKLALRSVYPGLGWMEISSHLSLEMARDEILSSPGFLLNDASEFTALWDAGVELSTSRKKILGWELKTRKFSLLPSPSQRFGDGALLVGSTQLPSETGYRLSLGPWLKTRRWTLELSGFTESARNSPIQVGISPNTAKTLPLGGVSTRGVQLESALNLEKLLLKSSMTFQESVSLSQIRWEQGHSIPGRPRFLIRSEGEYSYRSFKWGARHAFKSEDALDTNGFLFQSPQHVFDLWLGYAKKSWELRLIGNNLFPNYQLPKQLSFQGSASHNLLEPNIQQREIRLVCEIII